jgi:RNA polymerase sigma-70 factor (ECF subfamily)
MKYFGLNFGQESAIALTRQGASLNQDETMLIQAARVDPVAFDELYQRYLTPIYRYLCLHTYSEEDAADLTQQVFLQALQALPRYRERQLPFAAWLFRIAHNLAVDNYRYRRNMVTWDWLTEPMHSISDSNPETILLERENLLQLRQLFEDLSPDKKELLALRFAAGFTAREIAIVVGKHEEAVQKQLLRIIGRLRKQFKEQSR